MVAVVVVFAVAAALVNAVTSFLQRLGVEGAPRTETLSNGVVAHAIRRPIWLFGFACMLGGFVFQALALHTGALAVVQPLLTTELLFVVLILWAWFGIAVRPRDWLYASLTIAGLATFLVVVAPTNPGHAPTTGTWLVAMAATAGAVVSLAALSRSGPPWWRALILGAAASVGFALTAALTKAFSDAFAVGISDVVTSWETYALCVVGLSSFVLMQHAFHAGPFAASQSTLILINPFVSVGLGAWLYGESFPRGAGVVVAAVLAVVVFGAGAIGLCLSPLVAGVHASDAVQLLAGRGRLARHRAARDAEH
jgi:drug/metabolite transporter (DMT)-like permease